MSFKATNIISDLLVNDAGAFNANVNGGSTPVRFKITPDRGNIFYIHRILVFIQDARTNFDSDAYGALTALSNGVAIGIYEVEDDELVHSLTDLDPVKTNSGWGRLCYDASIDDYGNGEATCRARFTLSNFGGPLILPDTQYLAAVIQDDLTGLTRHLFTVEGHTLKPRP